jgi:fermentation-respiration switch protein FrsA (DUF1100 family)
MSLAPTQDTKATQRRKWHPWRWLLFATLAYLTVCVVMMCLENRLLYRPHSFRDDWRPPASDLPVQDVWLTSSDGTRIHAWWLPNAGAQDAVLFCHGNAGNLSHRQQLRTLWQESGHSVLIFDYPGFGRSEGEPSEAGCYAAADAAYNWLVRRVAPERVVLFGQSLGGGVATDLAVRQRHRALVLFKTFTSIPDVAQRQCVILPARWLVRNRFDNLTKIARCPGPVFIAHGANDHLIPFAQGERLFAAAPEPKRFFPMPGVGHHGGVTSELLAAVAAFLKEVDASNQRR